MDHALGKRSVGEMVTGPRARAKTSGKYVIRAVIGPSLQRSDSSAADHAINPGTAQPQWRPAYDLPPSGGGTAAPQISWGGPAG